MTSPLILHWFRQDLRLTDNPALYDAAKSGRVLAVYVLEDEEAGEYRIGSASRWWLHHSLASLNTSLGGNLLMLEGRAETIIPQLAREYQVQAVHWNRCYEPWRIQRDKRIKEALQTHGITATSFNGSLLWEPWDVLKHDGMPYKVFTPYYHRGCLQAHSPRTPLPKPTILEVVTPPASSLEDLSLLPMIPWDAPLKSHWQQGEAGAIAQLTTFLECGLQGYQEARDYPELAKTSRLSPYLHFGEISPNQVWYAAQANGDTVDVNHFCRELGWREFSYSLLYHFPELPSKNWQNKFDKFPWQRNDAVLKLWQQGKTGYPIVDAGMRELWQTGTMHNRVRMIVGSFLVKNLLIDWREGAQWFWDCLVDADLASNSASWQWVAGSGADAAPYFRIFNPITQGEKFDSAGKYTRRFVPELAQLPDNYLFKPWLAPEEMLQRAGVKLGKNYPYPIVEVKSSRERALAAFKCLS